jgi:hypothetical protein
MSKAKKFQSAGDLWIERGSPAPSLKPESKIQDNHPLTSHEKFNPKIPKRQNTSQMESETGMAEVESLYRRARYQKLYGEDPAPDLKFPHTLSTKLVEIHRKYPTDLFRVVAVFILKDDLGNKIPGKSTFLQSISSEVFFVKSLSMNYGRNVLILTLKVFSRSLHKAITTLPKAHIIQVFFPQHSRRLFGFFENSPLIEDSIAEFIEYDYSHMYPKTLRKNRCFSPPPEFFEPLIPYILPWITGKHVTALRWHWDKNDNPDLLFYRNKNHVPLVYDHETILREIYKGAFAWVPDSHFHLNSEYVGPYVATIDLDCHHLIEYSDLLERVEDYYTFLIDIVQIRPVLTHSGNFSFHFKLFLGEKPEDLLGIILPRLTKFSTYYKRHKNEITLRFIKDAIDILSLAYNHTTTLGPVGCNFRKYKFNPNIEIIFDNRTGIHQGARIPGSFHHMSGRIARTFKHSEIPISLPELEAMTSLEYIAAHPSVLKMPYISQEEQNSNIVKLLTFTSEYFKNNFHQLIYEEKIFNG